MDKIKYKDFYCVVGYSFKNVSFLNHALCHASLSKTKLASNQRLEFLGDRVLGLSIAKLLYNLYPEELEGVLSVKYANLVSTKTLSSVAIKIGLPSLIEVSLQEQKRLGSQNKNILADCCEAVLGAIFLDSNFDTVFKVIENLWNEELSNINIASKDYKTILQEYTQKNLHTCPEYVVISKTGSEHLPIFTIQTKFRDITGEATGNSKKEAEQNAALSVLQQLNLI